MVSAFCRFYSTAAGWGKWETRGSPVGSGMKVTGPLRGQVIHRQGPRGRVACRGQARGSKYAWSQFDTTPHTVHTDHTWFHHATHCWKPSRMP